MSAVTIFGSGNMGRVVDITNPLDFDTFAELKVRADSSAAAGLQATLPKAMVVKGFNTNFAATPGTRQVGPNTTVVLVAGDDVDASTPVLDLVRGSGLVGVDAGGLARVPGMEAVGFLPITPANDEKIAWCSGFGLVR